MPDFTERRRTYRLPYQSKIIFSDGKTSQASYAINISKGGLFILTMHPYPIDSTLKIVFSLSEGSPTLSLKGKVAHIVYDKQRCEVECGMGIQFVNLSSEITKSLNQYIANSKLSYLELNQVLKPERPNTREVARLLKTLPQNKQDLTYLRYRIERICTLFDRYEEDEAQLKSA